MAPSFAVHARRGAAALATAAVLSAAVAPAAFADGSPSPATAPGLYGKKDPQFDGVFRQSLALLAQKATNVAPPKQATDWLAGQQCADGGFAAYRADTAKACDPKAGEFTDQTALAVQGLVAAGGHGDAVKKGLDWLKAHQNEDGGWGMTPGSPSDPNSTSTAIGAYAAAGQDPAKATAKGGKSPYDALIGFQLGCDQKEDERGVFAYPDQKGKLAPNDLATTAAALAALGKGYLVAPAKGGDMPVKPLECADDESAKPKDAPSAGAAAAAYLAAKLDANGGFLRTSMPGTAEGPDAGLTTDAALSLAAGGHLGAADKPLKWLHAETNETADWAKGDPGRLSKLVLAVNAAGANPRDFAGVDLVQQLTATGPKAEASPSSTETKDEKKKDDDTIGIWWIVGIFFVASVGVGFLISGRNKKQQL
ncbi:prenyltransferase/squalene oxidase repeat-containing protein [Streptomyces netropsis]|uniref:prenyltransferase/squalene oxidase repeat-containing protein n=1 Tax=Streptomyces netropsis TaxID=55404 RepID=UPI0030CD6134